MNTKKKIEEYRVLDQVFINFHDARAHAEKESWSMKRPVVVRAKSNGRPCYRADIRITDSFVKA